MVGWLRRNRENRERDARYQKWYAGLTPEKRAAEDADVRKLKRQLEQVIFVLLVLLAIVVLWGSEHG